MQGEKPSEEDLRKSRQSLHNCLDLLLDKYSDKPSMLVRLKWQLAEAVPSALACYEVKSIERAERVSILAEACLEFSTRFLNENAYFRCEGSGMFVNYDGTHIWDADEDDIQHHILTEISTSPMVAQRKHKTKVHILKKIKSRPASTITPEEETINYVVSSLHPTFFLSTSAARHFLAAVGESLLGERSLTYICAPVLRVLLNVLEDAANELLGQPTALSHFKKKYYSHEHTTLRFFLCDFQRGPAQLGRRLRSHVLDILVVALHTARTYGSADRFVEETLCTPLSVVVNFSRNSSRDEIVGKFVADSLVPCDGAVMTPNEAWFALREYFTQHGLPVILFQDEFQSSLRKLVPTADSVYIGYTSPCLPLVRAFANFWEENMTSERDAYPLDIEAIITLFTKGTRSKPACGDPGFFRSLILHLYPDVLVDEWTVCGCACKIWPKDTVVREFCKELKLKELCPATVAESYDLYLVAAQGPVIKRNEFGNILTRVFPAYVSAKGLILPVLWTNGGA